MFFWNMYGEVIPGTRNSRELCIFLYCRFKNSMDMYSSLRLFFVVVVVAKMSI